MRNILSGFLFSLALITAMISIPKILLFFGILVGWLWNIILLVILSLSFSIVYSVMFKWWLTDVFNAIAAFFYVIFFILKSIIMGDIDGGWVIANFYDVLFISLGAAFLIFISLSIIGKVLQKR